MLRSAAKNFASVAVVTDPVLYDAVLEEMRAHDGATTYETRLKFAFDVFNTTAQYDGAIAAWLTKEINPAVVFPEMRSLNLSKAQDLRYGENPHQSAAFFRVVDYPNAATSLAYAQQLQGKELSYNNYLDLDAAWTAVREYDEPACVIVKHLTPCGVAVDTDVVSAYVRAHEADPVLAVRARHVDDRGSSGRDLVVGLAQQSLVGAERAERRIAAAPAGPRAAAAAVRAVVVGLAGEDRVAVGARIGGAADGVAARRLVADGGDEGGVVVEALVALFGGLLGCSLRRESAHLLEVGDGFFGGSARQRYGCGEDGGPDEGDRGSFFDGERSLRGCDARDAEGDRRAERERATGGVRYH